MGYLAVATSIFFFFYFIVGCSSNNLSVRPSTTTITYGKDNSTGEKDAKNDVLTNNEKESWTIKQVFKWE